MRERKRPIKVVTVHFDVLLLSAYRTWAGREAKGFQISDLDPVTKES
jgi:hypothetical protein